MLDRRRVPCIKQFSLAVRMLPRSGGRYGVRDRNICTNFSSILFGSTKKCLSFVSKEKLSLTPLYTVRSARCFLPAAIQPTMLRAGSILHIQSKQNRTRATLNPPVTASNLDITLSIAEKNV